MALNTLGLEQISTKLALVCRCDHLLSVVVFLMNWGHGGRQQ